MKIVISLMLAWLLCMQAPQVLEARPGKCTLFPSGALKCSPDPCDGKVPSHCPIACYPCGDCKNILACF